jgi:FixJ family two-component response regulator
MAVKPKRGPRIVLVDDDPGMNQAMERLFKAAGFDPIGFPSGEELLKSEMVHTADCLVLDLHLPGISGIDLTRQLKRMGVPCAIILITAFDDVGTRQEADAVGAAAYFTKPFSGSELMSAILGAIEEAPRSGIEKDTRAIRIKHVQ